MMKTLLSALILVLVSATASAGRINILPLEINFDKKMVRGTLKNTRYSDNSAAYLGCGLRTKVSTKSGKSSTWGY